LLLAVYQISGLSPDLFRSFESQKSGFLKNLQINQYGHGKNDMRDKYESRLSTRVLPIRQFECSENVALECSGAGVLSPGSLWALSAQIV